MRGFDDAQDSSIPLESRFQSISPIADTSYVGPDSADLSLSELSLNVKPSDESSKPFSLLARPSQAPLQDEADTGAEDGEEEALDTTVTVEDAEARSRSVARSRDERLHQDLFVLQKLNSAFLVYNTALADTQATTERVSEQLKQTDSLLNKYIEILGKSEETINLIFDERWHGADDDEATIERRHLEAQERARREEEERALAERRERERQEKEEQERLVREERERAEAEKREKLAIRAGYGSIRGVRGTRASAARARGAAISRAASTTASRGRIPSSATVNNSGGRYSRPPSAASARSAASSRASMR